MTRDEHLAWAKQRAVEYLPGSPQQAAESFLSDITKHEDGLVVNPAALKSLMPLLLLDLQRGYVDGVRRWIEGWN
jgi:hypothetical protein